MEKVLLVSFICVVLLLLPGVAFATLRAETDSAIRQYCMGVIHIHARPGRASARRNCAMSFPSGRPSPYRFRADRDHEG